MTRIVMAGLAALALALPVAGQAQQPAEVAEFTVAGIPVIYKPIRANDVIAVRLYIEGGSANLTAENAGIENLMTAAATHGTEKYTRDEFAALSAATGTAIGATANPDYTFLVIDAMIGQAAVETAEAFHQTLELDGVILS